MSAYPASKWRECTLHRCPESFSVVPSERVLAYPNQRLVRRRPRPLSSWQSSKRDHIWHGPSSWPIGQINSGKYLLHFGGFPRRHFYNQLIFLSQPTALLDWTANQCPYAFTLPLTRSLLPGRVPPGFGSPKGDIGQRQLRAVKGRSGHHWKFVTKDELLERPIVHGTHISPQQVPNE